MVEYIATIVVSLVFLAIGISNLCGNISMMHSYHRNHVKEEDRKPMGRLAGLGMIIIALSILIGSTGSYAAELTEKPIYNIVGMSVMAVGFVFGLALNLYAIKKYNGKIFG